MQTSNIPPRKAKKKRRIWPWVLMVLVFISAALAGAYYASNSLLEKYRKQLDFCTKGIILLDETLKPICESKRN